MYKNPKLTLQKGDLLVICLVAVLAALLAVSFFPRSGQKGAIEIYQDGHLARRFSAGQEAELLIEGDYTNRVVIREGRVAIVESDCPGGDCVHMGWIEDGGQSIVCLPNRVEIRIVGAETGVDAVVG